MKAFTLRRFIIPAACLALGLAMPLAAALITGGIYDEQAVQPNTVDFTMGYSTNTSWSTGIGEVLGAEQILGLEEFRDAVAAAFADGRGGVVDFDSGELDDSQSFTAVFADGAKSVTFANHPDNGGSYTIDGPSANRTAISGERFLATGGNPHFDFVPVDLAGFEEDEAIIAIGVSLLGRNGNGGGRNFRVIAWYTDGVSTSSSSTFRSFDMQNGNGLQDSFAGIAAPPGHWITRVRVHSDNGVYTGIDDLAFITGLVAPASPRELLLEDGILTRSRLGSTVATLRGRAELRLTQSSELLTGSEVRLDSPDAWLVFSSLRPWQAMEWLGHVRVNGAPAAADQNVRVVQFGNGSVVIPHGPGYQPLEVFTGRHFTGRAKSLGLHTYHNSGNLGEFTGNIRSLRLKRGYMLTIANNADGTGRSRNYIAQDGDLELGVLPSSLDQQVGYLRVFPWRWVNKKGWAGGSDDAWRVSSYWNYDWGASGHSSRDLEYVPMRHNRWWDSYPDSKTNVTHLLGFNEPDRPDQANMSVAQAIAEWPNLMRSGLRLGSPAPADSGLWWLYQFIDEADARGYRVDFVAVHFYHGGATADQLYSWLRDIHLRTGRPLWVTEWNNGANWTCCAPATWEENARITDEFARRMEDAPFVERYAVYNWVQPRREMILNGQLTAAGQRYRDNASSPSYQQVVPAALGSEAYFPFDGDARDYLGNGNHAMVGGTPRFAAGRVGQAIEFDGDATYLHLPSGTGRASAFSFAGWMRWDGGARWQRVFDFSAADDRYLMLTPRSGSDTMLFTIRSGGTERQVSAPMPEPGEWHHVAATLGGGRIRLYVDGVEVASQGDVSATPSGLGINRQWIGRSRFGRDPMFAGALDELRIANRAFSASEIQAMAATPPPVIARTDLPDATVGTPYLLDLATIVDHPRPDTLRFEKSGGPGWLGMSAKGLLFGVPATADAGMQSLVVRIIDPAGADGAAAPRIHVRRPAGLLAYYDLERNVRTSVGEAHGSPSGDVIHALRAGRRGADLNGVDASISLPGAVLGENGPFTLAAWLFWRGGPADQPLFDFGNGNAEWLRLTPLSPAGTLRLTIRHQGLESKIEAAQAVPVGQWTHIAASGDGTTTRLYRNGVEVAAGLMHAHPSMLAPSANFIGRGQAADGPRLNGVVARLALFDRALDAGEIAAMAGHEAPRIAAPGPIPAAVRAGNALLRSVAAAVDGAPATVFSGVSIPNWLRVSPAGLLFGVPGDEHAGIHDLVLRASSPGGAALDFPFRVVVTPPPRLLAHFGFDDGDAADLAGVDAGTVEGGVVFGDGLFGRAARFNGSNTAIRLPASTRSLENLSLVMRFRREGPGNWQRVFDFGDSEQRRVFLSPDIGGTLRLAVVTPQGEHHVHADPPVIGDWVHVVVTLAESGARLIINGVPAGIVEYPSGTLDYAPATRLLGASLTANRVFLGSIDDFRILDGVIDDAEAADLAFAAFLPPRHDDFSAWSAAHAGGAAPEAVSPASGLPYGAHYLFGVPTHQAFPNPQPVHGMVRWPKNPAAIAGFSVQTSSNMAPEGQPGGWQDATLGVVDAGNEILFTPPPGHKRLFIRLKILLP